MADPTIPFKGLFGFDDVVAVGSANDLSALFIDLTYTPDRTKITRGPYLSTNHREDVVGSTGVTTNFTLGKMDATAQLQFFKDWDDGTLMEYMYFADSSDSAALADPPVGKAANPSIMAQFLIMNPPVIATIQDEEVTWSPGDVLAKYFRFSDGTTTVEVGTAT